MTNITTAFGPKERPPSGIDWRQPRIWTGPATLVKGHWYYDGHKWFDETNRMRSIYFGDIFMDPGPDPMGGRFDDLDQIETCKECDW